MKFGEHVGKNKEPDLYIYYEEDDTPDEKAFAYDMFWRMFRDLDRMKRQRLKEVKGVGGE